MKEANFRVGVFFDFYVAFHEIIVFKAIHTSQLCMKSKYSICTFNTFNTIHDLCIFVYFCTNTQPKICTFQSGLFGY
jgi:hypothetical protein